MKIQGLTTCDLYNIVTRVSSESYDLGVIFAREPEWRGRWLHFTLRTVNGSSQGARRTNSGRKLAKACWHAHRDVMRAIFDAFPDAELVTMLAVYNGADNFNALFQETGKYNLGSTANPCRADSACECNSIGA